MLEVLNIDCINSILLFVRGIDLIHFSKTSKEYYDICDKILTNINEIEFLQNHNINIINRTFGCYCNLRIFKLKWLQNDKFEVKHKGKWKHERIRYTGFNDISLILNRYKEDICRICIKGVIKSSDDAKIKILELLEILRMKNIIDVIPSVSIKMISTTA